jgi:hypothetical protein
MRCEHERVPCSRACVDQSYTHVELERMIFVTFAVPQDISLDISM